MAIIEVVGGAQKQTSDSSKSILVGRLFSPNKYLYVLWGLYALAFIPSPLGWLGDVLMDWRYLPVYLAYTLSFALGTFLMRLQRVPLLPLVEPTHKQFLNAYLMVFGFGAFCLLARAAKMGGFAIFANNKVLFRRDFVEALGGFVSYPIYLITLCGVVAGFKYLTTKRRVWLQFWVICTVLQFMQINRQEILICLVAPFMALMFFKRISGSRIVLLLVAAVVALYALGFVSIDRVGGAQNVSRSISALELPIWVTLGDLTGTVRFGHQVLDAVGAGGLNGKYVWGVYKAIVGLDDGVHGAIAMRDMFTTAKTAQSIPAPISYLADGGWFQLVIMGVIQGALAKFLWRQVKEGHAFPLLVYVINFLAALWTVRSGTPTFSPIFLLQFAALSFMFRGYTGWTGYPLLISRLAAVFFMLVIPVCLIAAFARL